MQILLFLIPLSLLCSTIGLLVFVMAVNNGQFDDLESQSSLFSKLFKNGEQ